MTTRKLAGAKHDRCIGHVAHPYPKGGKLCIGSSIGEVGMVAFADLMAEKAAEHRAAFLAERPAAPESWYVGTGKARKLRPIGEFRGHPVVPSVCDGTRCHESSVHAHAGLDVFAMPAGSHDGIAELASRFRLMRAGEPAADSYVGAVARAYSRKAKVAVTRHVEITEPAAPDPMTICNGCDAAPALPESPAGYCADCEAAAREPEPVAEPSRCWQYLHTQGGTRRCMVQPDLHDGPHEYEEAITPIGPRAQPVAETAAEPIAEPEPIEEYPTVTEEPAAPVLSVVPTSGRPTCPRCGQSFRKSGIGLAWHVANRPDCAAGRLAVA